jgi:hypothetical protein
VRVLVEVVFSVTDPKARVLALTVNCGVAAAVPVPLKLILLVLPPDELLKIVMVPFAAPATVGSKPTWRVTVWPGFSVAGAVAPEIEKPRPERPIELMVIGAVPDDVRVIDCVVVELSAKSPKFRFEVLIVSSGVTEINP